MKRDADLIAVALFAIAGAILGLAVAVIYIGVMWLSFFRDHFFWI